jgi:large subunit ribosomal protein L21
LTLICRLVIINICQGGGVIIYAIVETAGKQFRVSPGQTLKVDRLELAEGATVELDRVLAIGNDNKLTVGKPTVEGARVMATVKGEGQDKKVVVFKYKAKTRYTRKQGHRQLYTELTIDSIAGAGETPVKAAAKPRRTKKEVTENGS